MIYLLEILILSIFFYFHVESYGLFINSYKFNKVSNNNNQMVVPNPGIISLCFPRANHCRLLVLNALNNNDFNIINPQDKQEKLDIEQLNQEKHDLKNNLNKLDEVFEKTDNDNLKISIANERIVINNRIISIENLITGMLKFQDKGEGI